MKFKKGLALILVIAIIAIMTIMPTFAASVGFSAGNVSSDGTVTFTLTVSDSDNKVGSIDVDFSANGGTITKVTTSSGSPVWGGTHLSNAVADSPSSMSVYVTCKMTSESMTLSYSGLLPGDGTGDNELSVSSTSGSASAKMPATTAAPTTAPKTTASTAANLKNLSVNGYTLNPKFSQSRTSYTVQIPKDLTSLDITATPLNADAKVTITGDKNFTAGQSNTIKILVKAADGTTKTYTIKTVFEAETTVPVTQKVNLTNLKLKAATDIKFAFVPTTYEYTVTVPKGTTTLNVDAIADQIEGAKVDVVGADDLKASNNKVVITVTSPDGTQTVYTINVKYASDEVVTPETKGGLPAWAVILIALASFVVGGFALGYVIYVVIPKRKNNHPDDPEDDDYDDDNNDDNNSNGGNTGASGGYTPGEYSFVHSADD